jgi:hypothetical protein
LEANDLTGFQNAGFLNTLALAYHRTGDTRQAIETQKKAIALLPDAGARARPRFEQQLAEFEAALGDRE